MKRNDPNRLVDFTRGSELWTHQLKMFFNGLANALIGAVIILFLIMGGYLYVSISPLERYAIGKQITLTMQDTLQTPNQQIQLNINGKEQSVPLEQAKKILEPHINSAYRDIKISLYLGLILAFGLVASLIIYWWYYGKDLMQDERLRGAQIVSPADLKSLIEHRNEVGNYTIAGVPMRARSETMNIVYIGVPGSGKSQGIRAMLEQIRAHKRKAFIYDPSGEFVQEFYREGIDIILNPVDARSPQWNVWQEIKADYHYDNIAMDLIPESPNGDPFWCLAGRRLLTDIMRTLGKSGLITNKQLYESVSLSKLEEMYNLLAGTAGQNFVDPKADKTGINLKMTVLNQLESFRYLVDEGELFSIRDWTHQDNDSWIFLSTKDEVKEAIKPVLSLWVSTFIRSVMTLPVVHKEKLWLGLDELPTLQRLEALELSLTNTRKYGLCHLIGFQDYSQLIQRYGENNARTMLSTMQTKICLRVTEEKSAEAVSKMIGSMEVDEKNMSRSMGINSGRDGDSFYTQRKDRLVVMPSEIMTLPDLTGYLKLPSDLPVAKIVYEHVSIPVNAPPFVERTERAKYDFQTISKPTPDQSTEVNPESDPSDLSINIPDQNQSESSEEKKGNGNFSELTFFGNKQ